MSYGWICPKCQNVYAPTVQSCWQCSTIKEATCSTECKCQQCGNAVTVSEGMHFGVLCHDCNYKSGAAAFTSQIT